MSETEARARACLWILYQRWPWNVGEASWAMDESCSLWTWPDPNCFSSICGMGGLLSGLLPQVSHQKRNSKAEPWGRVKGQPELCLKIGA